MALLLIELVESFTICLSWRACLRVSVDSLYTHGIYISI